MKNDRYLQSLLRKPVDITPVWMMRQAGRYLPEYRRIRNQVGNFVKLYKDADLACEVTLQPLRRYPLDAAILFSDILTIPDAMGLGLYFDHAEGPKFSHPITSFSDVRNISIPDPEQELVYVMNAIRNVNRELKGDLPLIGFSGSPWTLAAYMVEGSSSKLFAKIKKMVYSDPATLHLLLEKLTQTIVLYLDAQIQAGVQSIIVFDTWGGVLSGKEYKEFSLNYMHKIVDSTSRENNSSYVPITLFTKGGGAWLEMIAETGCDAIGLDWNTDVYEARRRVGGKVCLQGNMDPAVLHAPPHRIEQEVMHILKAFGKGTGHIFNLGHGIHKDTPTSNVSTFINAVHCFSSSFHQ
jgi:uroporphyrinogen decarboxylase